MREPVVILGGGIGGLACAVALQKHGLACHVFEQAPRLEEIGAGLLLTPNAVAVLEALNLLAQLRPHALITPAWHILDPQGRDLQVLRPFPSGQPALSTRRSDLQRVLAGALAGESLHLDHEATSLVLQQDGVRVRFRDRADVVAPLVVVADGAASRLGEPCPGRGLCGTRATLAGVPLSTGRPLAGRTAGLPRPGAPAVALGSPRWAVDGPTGTRRRTTT
ncbi:MAG: FAD-dependent monooxygenase [Ardenticatenia bacterium]|nr:FAD-dependent monooxygenase [Ardenticatenia bacterium]